MMNLEKECNGTKEVCMGPLKKWAPSLDGSGHRRLMRLPLYRVFSSSPNEDPFASPQPMAMRLSRYTLYTKITSLSLSLERKGGQIVNKTVCSSPNQPCHRLIYVKAEAKRKNTKYQIPNTKPRERSLIITAISQEEEYEIRNTKYEIAMQSFKRKGELTWLISQLLRFSDSYCGASQENDH